MAELAQPYRHRGRSRIHAVPAGEDARATRSTCVKRANHPNAHILIDALHVFRSKSDAAAVRRIDPAMLGPVQLCDAPAQRRRPTTSWPKRARAACCPAQGELDLAALLDALPSGLAYGVEVPLASQRPDLDPGARLALLVKSTREFLQRRNA